MKSVLSNSPSWCVQGQTNSPSLPHCTALLLLLNTPVETGGRACGCRGPHRYMYNQVLHRSSQLTRQTPAFQLLFQTYGWKKKQTLSVQFRQRKSGSNKKREGSGEEMRVGKQHADHVETLGATLTKNSPVGLRSGHRQLLFLSSSTRPCNSRNCFHCDIFIYHFFPFGAIYKVRCWDWRRRFGVGER